MGGDPHARARDKKTATIARAVDCARNRGMPIPPRSRPGIQIARSVSVRNFRVVGRAGGENG